ncbi:MAG: glutathione S-transferase family protein [Paracoccaceae bacterium]
MTAPLRLISHALCPCVQRAAIALAEQGVAFERTDIDLEAKPGWFLALSPLGKTPVLLVGDRPVFESAVILEYLEDTGPRPLHPADPFDRARHRGWIELASAVLNNIAALYSAPDETALQARRAALAARFRRIDAELGNSQGPWFAGRRFSLVDAAFAPVFRYFDLFERLGDFGPPPGLARIAAWRRALAARPSVAGAVRADYPALLFAFLCRRDSCLGGIARAAACCGFDRLAGDVPLDGIRLSA